MGRPGLLTRSPPRRQFLGGVFPTSADFWFWARQAPPPCRNVRLANTRHKKYGGVGDTALTASR
jgi:hypothetical protein